MKADKIDLEDIQVHLNLLDLTLLGLSHQLKDFEYDYDTMMRPALELVWKIKGEVESLAKETPQPAEVPGAQEAKKDKTLFDLADELETLTRALEGHFLLADSFHLDVEECVKRVTGKRVWGAGGALEEAGQLDILGNQDVALGELRNNIIDRLKRLEGAWPLRGKEVADPKTGGEVAK